MTRRCPLSSSPAPYPLTILLLHLIGDTATAILFPIQRIVQFAIVGFLIFAGTPSLAAESPTEVVRATLTEVFRILEDPKLKDPAKLMSRRRMLEEVIARHFDYTEMSKRTLASHWTPLTNEQRAEFVDLFKNFLSDRYAGKIEGYPERRFSTSASGSKASMRRSAPSSCQAKSRSRWTTA